MVRLKLGKDELEVPVILSKIQTILRLQLTELRWIDTELAMLELLENACKYTAQDKYIWILVSCHNNPGKQTVQIRLRNQAPADADFAFLELVTKEKSTDENLKLYENRLYEIAEILLKSPAGWA